MKIFLPTVKVGEGKTSMTNRQRWQILYWFITGGLIGLGIISFDILFLAGPCLLVGLSLGTFGIIRWGTNRLWIAFLGLGILPALFLMNDIISASPLCTPRGLTIPPNAPSGMMVTCGTIPPTYYILLACFGGVALVRGIWPILRRLMWR